MSISSKLTIILNILKLLDKLLDFIIGAIEQHNGKTDTSSEIISD